MHRFLVGLATLLAAALFACKSQDDCGTQGMSLDVDISVPEPSLRASIKSLSVELAIGADLATRTYEIDRQLASGRTSLRVVFDHGVVPGEGATVSVYSYGTPAASGVSLAEAHKGIALIRGCNRAEVALVTASKGSPGGADASPLPSSPDGGPTNADGASMAPSPDVGVADAGESDGASALPDASPQDSGARGVRDASATLDGSSPPPPDAACPTVRDDQTVALYSFDDALTSTITDVLGRHNGILLGPGASTVQGPAGCGSALRFPLGTLQGPMTYGLVRDSPDFALAQGSVDLWVYDRNAPPHVAELGVFARDAVQGTIQGLSIRIACDGTIVAKVEAANGARAYQCSSVKLMGGTWAHVGVNFGPPGLELYVDGQLQTRTGTVGLFGIGCGQTIICGTSLANGIDGAGTAPWVMGADPHNYNPANGTGMEGLFREGAIDEVRISSARRVFGF